MVTSLHTHNPSTDQSIHTVTATGPTFKPVFNPKSNSGTPDADPQLGCLSTTVDRTTGTNGRTAAAASLSRERHQQHQQSPPPLSQGRSSLDVNDDDWKIDEKKWVRISKKGWRYGSMGFYEWQ
jgi:hypothetical protein